MASNTIIPLNNQPLEEDFFSNDLEGAIIRTVIYSDLFNYPLKKKEIRYYLNGIKCSQKMLNDTLDELISKKKLIKTKSYYHLPNRVLNVEIREKRIIYSKNLWKKTLFYVSILRNLPFIKMISITGALALSNAKKKDDIDLFIVTTENRLWIARIFVVILMKIGYFKKDHLCPNYLVSDGNLEISKKNMYSAREIVNMIPIYNQKTYLEFIDKNSWVENYYPNFQPKKLIMNLQESKFLSLTKKIGELILSNPLFELLDLFEMKRTSEKLTKMSNEYAENIFLRNCCKSHLEGHAQKISNSYTKKVKEII